MDMTLSKRGDYVMRAAISLARTFDEGRPRKIREIVADTNVPRNYASQILADLVRAELVGSKAGREGGYQLRRPPREISVLEVVEAAEGSLRAERCALGEGPCRWEVVCPLHETWSQATVVIRDLLAKTTLAELAERDAAIEAGTYSVPADSHRPHPLAVDVSDVVQVEMATDQLHLALARVATELGPLLDDGAADGTRRAPRRGGTVPASEASLVPTGAPGRKKDSAGARYLLAWRILDPAHSGRLEAELSVGAVDPERSELRVEGTWRQDPMGASALGAAEVEQMARRTVRSFLRRLARKLEEQAYGPPRPRQRRAT